MKKTAVVFPGVGYTKDRPLLYYSGKLAAGCGYELKSVDFSGIDWSKEKLKDRDFLARTLERCLDITQRALSGIDGLSGGSTVFISKSIGTVVATAFAKAENINAKQLCFSPLEMIEDHVNAGGAILFCGDADPYADYSALERIANEKDLEMHRIAGGNHSLETGDIFTDIDNMRIMMKKVYETISV